MYRGTTLGQENLGWDICGLIFGDCFTVGGWAKVRSCEAVLGGLFGRSSNAGDFVIG